jgi:hypothetical protein
MPTTAQARLEYDQHLATLSATLLAAALLRPEPQVPVSRHWGWKIATNHPSDHELQMVTHLCPAQWYGACDLQARLGTSRQQTHLVLARLCHWHFLRRTGTRHHFRWQRVEGHSNGV